MHPGVLFAYLLNFHASCQNTSYSFRDGRQLTRLHFDRNPVKVQYKRYQIISVASPSFQQAFKLQITIMSFVVPWDGVYRVENVAYFEQNIGLRSHDIIIAGRHEDATDPRIKVSSWTGISSHYYLFLITFAVGSQSHCCR